MKRIYKQATCFYWDKVHGSSQNMIPRAETITKLDKFGLEQHKIKMKQYIPCPTQYWLIH